MPALSSKRNSHHRRRSSVSTRHESAEIMGVSVPDLSASSSEDSASEKDSIRRRALWALEGKQADASYSKVEIPELSTPEIEKKLSDFSFAAPPSTGYGSGLNALMASKRDSFKPSSSKDQLHTLVEEEEEEEEWDTPKSSSPQQMQPSNDVVLPATPLTPDYFAKPTQPRPRPAALRPLSLTPDVVSTVVQGLPTPSSTPGARFGLKSLSLVPTDERRNSLVLNDVSPTPHSRARPVLNISTDTSAAPVDETSRPPIPTRRSSISYKSSSSTASLPTPEMTPTFAERRYSHNSLGSNASATGSSSNSDEDFFPQSNASYSRHRPLSVSEQHFLFKSHNALLARIQDLEKALSVRRTSMSSVPGSRPISSAYSVADSEDTSLSSEPSDEMLRLVADLKAERDELKRDVDGWRVRVGDLEKQIGLLGKRVEGERREAWVARSRTGLLEAEKNALEKELEQARNELRMVEEEKLDKFAKLREMIRILEQDKQRSAEENARLSKECDKWRAEVERLSKLEKDGMVTPTVHSFDPEHAHSAWRRGLQYTSVDTSIDSLASSTDVDFGSFGSDSEFGFSLKAVEEEHEGDLDLHSPQIPEEDVEEDYMSEEEDNGLAGYEDEEEEDMTFQSSVSSSSFGSDHEAFERRKDIPASSSAVRSSASASPSESRSNTPSTLTPGSRSPSSSPAPTDVHKGMDTFKFPRAAAPAPAPASTHRVIGSLSKTWTFPTVRPSTSECNDEVDKFFSCLEDSETDSTGSRSPVSPSMYTYEHNKGLFAKALEAFNDDEVMPFSLPPNVIGTIVEEPESPRSLEIVFEEEEEGEDDEQTKVDDDNDEDDNDMFGAFSGIKITVTPAADDDDDYDDEYPSPEFEDSDNEEDEEESEQAEEEDRTVNVRTEEPLSRSFSVRKPAPLFEEFDDGNEDDVPFNFGHPLRSSTPPTSTPPRNTVNARASSPSSIPRPTSVSSLSSSLSSLSSSSSSIISPSKLPTRSSSSFVTPPTKRGGAIASFIPQPISPVSSPSPMRKGPTLREKPPVASFIRQPARKPLMAANNAATKTGNNDSNGSASQSSNPVNSTYTQPSRTTSSPPTPLRLSQAQAPASRPRIPVLSRQRQVTA
jgi:hypothetical protein